jgi:hypothetical protein
MKVIKKEININITIRDDDKLFETIINLLSQQDNINMSYTISEDDVETDEEPYEPYDEYDVRCKLCKTGLPGWWALRQGDLCSTCDNDK